MLRLLLDRFSSLSERARSPMLKIETNFLSAGLQRAKNITESTIDTSWKLIWSNFTIDGRVMLFEAWSSFADDNSPCRLSSVVDDVSVDESHWDDDWPSLAVAVDYTWTEENLAWQQYTWWTTFSTPGRQSLARWAVSELLTVRVASRRVARSSNGNRRHQSVSAVLKVRVYRADRGDSPSAVFDWSAHGDQRLRSRRRKISHEKDGGCCCSSQSEMVGRSCRWILNETISRGRTTGRWRDEPVCLDRLRLRLKNAWKSFTSESFSSWLGSGRS